ncbi:MAG: TetR/AcrR family transcriptional regulator [Muribaculaceae bacterium]|nr:TetR/AcrR family transcriptional regulator [Muribaculaceae bacterium]
MTKHRNNKEKDILNAAKEEFLEKGYDGARTTSIAKSAGVTHAMLHYYFKTKEELFGRIFTDFINDVVTNLGLLFSDSDKTFLERVTEGITLHFNYVMENPHLPLFAVRELMSRPDRIDIIKPSLSHNVGRLYILLQQNIDEAIAKGEIAPNIDAPTLLIDMLSLNVFPFLVHPAYQAVVGEEVGEINSFLEQRKQENIELITRRLTPNKQ